MIGLDPVFQSYRSVRAAMPGHGSQQAACAVRFTGFSTPPTRTRRQKAFTGKEWAYAQRSREPELAFGLSNLGFLYSSQSCHREAMACVMEAVEIGRTLNVRSDRCKPARPVRKPASRSTGARRTCPAT